MIGKPREQPRVFNYKGTAWLHLSRGWCVTLESLLLLWCVVAFSFLFVVTGSALCVAAIGAFIWICYPWIDLGRIAR